MPPGSRRGLPDNLDPLVDTLSNVVGILVVVVALTQIQVGDAIERVMALDTAGTTALGPDLGVGPATDAETRRRLARALASEGRILDRTGENVDESLAAVESVLRRVEALPETLRPLEPDGREALSEKLADERGALEAARAATERREAYAETLRRVPRELVARLPDPEVLTGTEQWILCRYGRCYLADRPTLIDLGEKAIGRILVHRDARAVRPDEYEALALYLRKREVGEGNFRWQFETRPLPRARLEWRSREPGLEPPNFATSPELRRWLSARDPERDFVRFQVWNDSFEAYLEARRVVEAAGFRAGWKGFEADEELELPVTFGVRAPPERPVEVD